MNGKVNGKLVDTNVIIRVLKGVTELFPLFNDIESLFVSSISIGELMYGAALSAKCDFNTEHYSAFCDCMNVIVPDEQVARQYGKIKAQLKRDGHPIPENDIWIAATAMSANLTLVTADSDFNAIKGLVVESL